MAAENIIGAPMMTKRPTTVGGQATDNWHTQDGKWRDEITERVQTPLPPVTVLGSPASGVALSLSGAFSAASVLTPEADIRHGTRVVHFGPVSGRPSVGAPVFTGGATVNTGWASVAAADAVEFSLDPFAVGDRILQVFCYGTATAAQQWSATFYTLNMLTGAATALGTVLSTVGAVRRFRQVFNGTFTIANDNSCLLLEWTSVAAGGMSVYGVEVLFDRPGP